MRGDTGNNGVLGDDGEAGPTGPPGPQGAAGEEGGLGLKGPEGETGQPVSVLLQFIVAMFPTSCLLSRAKMETLDHQVHLVLVD